HASAYCASAPGSHASAAIAPDHFPQGLARLGFVGRVLDGVEVIMPPVCDVPAGSFPMGSDKRRDKDAQDNELPQKDIPVAAFQIARYPVTVAEYACAVRAKAVREPPQGTWRPITWQEQLKQLDHPVVCIAWNDALAYATWLAQVTKQPWRLPTEAEWEKAARGTDGRIYPWGDRFEPTRCNVDARSARGQYIGHTTPVGSYPSGASPYGAQDMAGNVWEWCSTRYQSYPYTANDGRENLNSTGNRVLRGGSWFDYPRVARAASRYWYDWSTQWGFRLACARSGLA
ncbi:MAG TPA: SUMF1/EgtB/PvdO family nonheme iron enzyme, partial [Ktedonobacterales bacterium]|nr:SUMF1/EgtB/PvdO family nonheme iron enzyme [Ktedonobacterales bacterium]